MAGRPPKDSELELALLCGKITISVNGIDTTICGNTSREVSVWTKMFIDCQNYTIMTINRVNHFYMSHAKHLIRIHFTIRKLRSLGVLLCGSDHEDHVEVYNVDKVETCSHTHYRRYICFSRNHMLPDVRHYEFDGTTRSKLFATTDFEEFVQYMTPKE